MKKYIYIKNRRKIPTCKDGSRVEVTEIFLRGVLKLLSQYIEYFKINWVMATTS